MRVDRLWTIELARVSHHKQMLILLRYTNKDHFPDSLCDDFPSHGFTLREVEGTTGSKSSS